MTSFFRVDSRSIFPEGWGDYGYILQHGMAAHSPREGGNLALERTGPFIPPITLPGIGDIVLTSEARRSLESSGLAGFAFLPVKKKLIVEVRWETWDLTEDGPPEVPESGEPEDYILGQPHNSTAAAALGELWEVSVPLTATIRRPASIVKSYRDLQLDLTTWNGSDLIKGSGYGSALFSERAREWFSEHWGKYVQFEPFRTT